MAEEVEQTLLKLLTADGMDRLTAVLHLQATKDERRFQTDVWGVTYSSLAKVKEDKAAMADRSWRRLPFRGKAPSRLPTRVSLRRINSW